MSNSPHQTASDLLVLHTLRCIGVADLSRIADVAGLAQSDVESELIDLAVAGLVTREPGGFGGWSVTDAGRTADSERIADELTISGARDVVTKAYEEFLVLNPELLDLCTAWQMRPVNGAATLNDHTDSAYDSRVLGLFNEFHERAEAVCAVLSVAIPRFERHQIRLRSALAKANAGEPDYLSERMDSYHSVWFHLHEDLLTTLGHSRWS